MVEPAKGYSQTLNGQTNPNSTKKWNKWEHEAYAVGHSSNYAQAKYTRKKGKDGKYTYTCPVYLSAHDFRLDIPENAYINEVVIEVRAKVSSNKLSIKAPTAWFMVYSGTGLKKVTQTKKGTGWYNDVYRVENNRKLSTSDSTYSYHFSGEEWNKMGYPSKQLNASRFGVDLHFDEPEKLDADYAWVKVQWVRVTVKYDMPDYYLTYKPHGTEAKPVEVVGNEGYHMKFEFGNRTKSDGGRQIVTIQLPTGTRLKGENYTCSKNSELFIIDEYEGIYEWHCDGGALAKNTLDMELLTTLAGTKKIQSYLPDLPTWDNYINLDAFQITDYTDCKIESGDIVQLTPSCFDFSTKVTSPDGVIEFQVTVEGLNPPIMENVSQALKDEYHVGNNKNFLIGWELLDYSAIQGVSINYSNSDYISFNVPPNEEVEILFRGCFIPIMEGSNQLRLQNMDTMQIFTYGYWCESLDRITLDFNPARLVFNDHRIMSNVDSDNYIIPFITNPLDRYMVQEDCSFRMHIWEQIAYIGCVPLEHSHYDPESDFQNDGLRDAYKNKVYTGKKGVIEEDIDLNIKVRPQQVTTLQGLAELDKPVPINTVPRAFEGDALNHRGWVELTKIKAKKTNPVWYDVKADVDYITHNINSRFEIKKGVKVVDYDIDTMMGTVVESGDEFANYTYINVDGDEVTTSKGYFNVDTDGIYIYDKKAAENQRTLISLDNAQFLRIKSVEELPEHFDISCEWSSTRIAEDKENNFERIFYLLDADGMPCVEYQYFDLQFTDEAYYTATVICRVMTSSGWQAVFSDDINFSADLESLNLMRDSETGELVPEPEPHIDEMESDDESSDEAEAYAYNDYMFGSTVHFTVHGDRLTIVDEGMSGRDIVVIHDLETQIVPRYYQVGFTNKNSDGDTNDVMTFFDFEVSESVLLSDYEAEYANLIVSSFPIPDKLLVFTRNSEEGTLFYYRDDGLPFTYIQEPFYMYFCGVDLKANNDVSIFNLNNSYTIFYLQNGLVRIGFNRLDGEIYLAKYDIHTGEYITVCNLQLINFTDFTIGSYSDDKIEVVAGTTIFTMYRGHPYVVIKHEGDDIEFKTVWNQVYGDGVNGQAMDMPVLWNLRNHNNMLPAEIGSGNIDASAWIVDTDDEDEHANIYPTLSLARHSEASVYTHEDILFDLSGSITTTSGATLDDEIPLDLTKYNGFLGDYTIDYDVDTSAPYAMFVTALPTIQSGETTEIRATVEDYEGKGVAGKTVYFYEEYEPTSITVSSDKSIIQSGQVADISAKLKDVDGSAIKDNIIYFYEKEEN